MNERVSTSKVPTFFTNKTGKLLVCRSRMKSPVPDRRSFSKCICLAVNMTNLSIVLIALLFFGSPSNNNDIVVNAIPQSPSAGSGGVANKLSSVTVSLEPKRPMTKCSGEQQKITCQLVDYEAELPKQMRKQKETAGYGGYVEFLLFRKSKSHQQVVSDIHVNYPSEILSPKSMLLENLTIFDKGEYNCTVLWHGIQGDNHWYSEPLQLNVYDCIDLEEEVREAKQGETVTMQCIDIDTPIQWYKDDDLLDEAVDGELARKAKGPLPGVRRIQMKSVEDAGVYLCKGTFEDTQQIFSKKTKVMLKTAPTTPINISPALGSLAPTSVILKWEQKPTANPYIVADPQFYTIFYKPMDSNTFLSKTVLKHPEVMLTNLKVNTVYFVRIQAENELGTSVSGSRLVVTPAENQMIEIDRRLLNLMMERVKILDQDLQAISSVISDITPSSKDSKGKKSRKKTDSDEGDDIDF